MLNTKASAASQTPEDRETRLRALIEELRPSAEAALRQMAERLVDLPEEKSFGQVEYDLRDLAHELACACHQTGRGSGETLPPRRKVERRSLSRSQAGCLASSCTDWR